MAGKIDEEPISSDDSAFGDVERVEVPGPDPTDPPSYRAGDYLNSTIGIGDATNRRLADFEDALRRNRVDITATCRACGVERDEIEYRRQDEDAA